MGINVKIKTIELEGEQLDHFVAIALGWEKKLWGAIPVWFQADGEKRFRCIGRDWKPSTNWQHGGPIIEREGICVAQFTNELDSSKKAEWRAAIVDGEGYFTSLDLPFSGHTYLVAAMRCFVAFKLGKEVEL